MGPIIGLGGGLDALLGQRASALRAFLTASPLREPFECLEGDEFPILLSYVCLPISRIVLLVPIFNYGSKVVRF